MTTAASIELDTSEVIRFAEALEKAPEVARKEIRIGVTQALLLLEREIKEDAPVGVGGGGGFRGSITHSLGSNAIGIADGIIGKVFSPLIYAQAVEFGTRPHFPPLAPIRDWVISKLGITGAEASTVAYLIALKISHRGTEGAHVFERNLEANTAQVLRFITAALDRVFEKLGFE